MNAFETWQKKMIAVCEAVLRSVAPDAAMRKASLAKFVVAKFDYREQELARRLDLETFWRTDFNVATARTALPKLTATQTAQIDKLILPDAYALVFCDGVWQKDFSKQQLPKGVTFAQNDASLFADESVVGSTAPLGLLNRVLGKSGATCKVADNFIVDKPLQLIFVTTDVSSGQASYRRNLFVAGKNSQLDFLLHYLDLSNSDHGIPNCNNIATQFNVDDGAKVNFYLCQQVHAKNFHFENVNVSLSAKAEFNFYHLALGGALLGNYWQCDFKAAASKSAIASVALLKGTEQNFLRLLLNHQVPETQSQTLCRNVASGQAKAFCQGRIVVAEGALKTVANLQNNNLLLQDGARIATLPELEVYADDVVCKHGATIGELDEAALFYLCSRGISKKLARQMLLEGFLHAFTDKIVSQDIRNYLQNLIDQQIEQIFYAV